MRVRPCVPQAEIITFLFISECLMKANLFYTSLHQKDVSTHYSISPKYIYDHIQQWLWLCSSNRKEKQMDVDKWYIFATQTMSKALKLVKLVQEPSTTMMMMMPNELCMWTNYQTCLCLCIRLHAHQYIAHFASN